MTVANRPIPSPLAPMTLPTFFEEDRVAVDAHLEKLLPSETTPPASIHEAMRYSVQAGGKRIRPILCLETARIFTADASLPSARARWRPTWNRSPRRAALFSAAI